MVKHNKEYVTAALPDDDVRGKIESMLQEASACETHSYAPDGNAHLRTRTPVPPMRALPPPLVTTRERWLSELKEGAQLQMRVLPMRRGWSDVIWCEGRVGSIDRNDEGGLSMAHVLPEGYRRQRCHPSDLRPRADDATWSLSASARHTHDATAAVAGIVSGDLLPTVQDLQAHLEALTANVAASSTPYAALQAVGALHASLAPLAQVKCVEALLTDPSEKRVQALAKLTTAIGTMRDVDATGDQDRAAKSETCSLLVELASRSVDLVTAALNANVNTRTLQTAAQQVQAATEKLAPALAEARSHAKVCADVHAEHKRDSAARLARLQAEVEATTAAADTAQERAAKAATTYDEAANAARQALERLLEARAAKLLTSKAAAEAAWQAETAREDQERGSKALKQRGRDVQQACTNAEKVEACITKTNGALEAAKRALDEIQQRVPVDQDTAVVKALQQAVPDLHQARIACDVARRRATDAVQRLAAVRDAKRDAHTLAKTVGVLSDGRTAAQTGAELTQLEAELQAAKANHATATQHCDAVDTLVRRVTGRLSTAKRVGATTATCSTLVSVDGAEQPRAEVLAGLTAVIEGLEDASRRVVAADVKRVAARMAEFERRQQHAHAAAYNRCIADMKAADRVLQGLLADAESHGGGVGSSSSTGGDEGEQDPGADSDAGTGAGAGTGAVDVDVD